MDKRLIQGILQRPRFVVVIAFFGEDHFHLAGIEKKNSSLKNTTTAKHRRHKWDGWEVDKLDVSRPKSVGVFGDCGSTAEMTRCHGDAPQMFQEFFGGGMKVTGKGLH